MYNFEHMRIAYFTDSFLPQVNGIATSLANQAKQLGDQGHQIMIFTPKLDDIPREGFRAKNVHIIHLPTIPALMYTELKLGVFGLPKVIKNLRSFKPDIIHLHTPFTVGMDAIMAAKIFKKPLVGSLHVYLGNKGYVQQIIKYNNAARFLGKFTDRYYYFIYNQCDLVISPSKLAAEELKSNGFKKPVAYIPNGVILDGTKLLSQKEQINFRKKYHLKEKVILHFGRLSHEKNVDVLIKSFQMLLKNHPDVSLLIIGDGPAKKSLMRITRRLGLEKNVIFTGFITHQMLLSSGLLSIGDVFATASPMEVNPMAVLEAMLYGLPIVGVKQAGLIELVTTNGFLVKPDSTQDLREKIERLLYDQKLAAKMSQESLKRIQDYSIEKTTDKLLHFYQETLNQR